VPSTAVSQIADQNPGASSSATPGIKKVAPSAAFDSSSDASIPSPAASELTVEPIALPSSNNAPLGILQQGISNKLATDSPAGDSDANSNTSSQNGNEPTDLLSTDGTSVSRPESGSTTINGVSSGSGDNSSGSQSTGGSSTQAIIIASSVCSVFAVCCFVGYRYNKSRKSSASKQSSDAEHGTPARNIFANQAKAVDDFDDNLARQSHYSESLHSEEGEFYLDAVVIPDSDLAYSNVTRVPLQGQGSAPSYENKPHPMYRESVAESMVSVDSLLSIESRNLGIRNTIIKKINGDGESNVALQFAKAGIYAADQSQSHAKYDSMVDSLIDLGSEYNYSETQFKDSASWLQENY
jgi:hypothetical protein